MYLASPRSVLFEAARAESRVLRPPATRRLSVSWALGIEGFDVAGKPMSQYCASQAAGCRWSRRGVSGRSFPAALGPDLGVAGPCSAHPHTEMVPERSAAGPHS